MLKNTVVLPYNVVILDYAELFGEEAEFNILNELYDLNLLKPVVLSCKTTHRVIANSVISAICEYIIHSKGSGGQPVFLVNKAALAKCELFEYVDHEAIFNYLDRLNKKLRRCIKINYFETELTYDQFVSDCESNDGDAVELLLNSIQSRDGCSLHHMYKYVTDNGLISIKQKFFDDIRFKQVLI